jgi:hypothetical protein
VRLGAGWLTGVLLVCGIATDGEAQLFWKSPSFESGVVHGDEPGLAIALPGATSVEQDANLVWTTRAGLNVAALQCQFSPALMTTRNYNDLIAHHRTELADSYAVLQAYFKRVATTGASARAVADAFDRFNTRTYSSFSTVNAQLGFCQTAAHIGGQALLEPKGRFGILAHERLRELRSSLRPVGDMINVSPAPLHFAAVAINPGDRCETNRRHRRCIVT